MSEAEQIPVSCEVRTDLALGQGAVFAHCVMNQDSETQLAVVKRMTEKPSVWTKFSRIFKPFLLENIDFLSGNDLKNTTAEAIKEAREICGEECNVDATVYNKTNKIVLDRLTNPVPDTVTVHCNAPDCCMRGIQSVVETVNREISASRGAFTELLTQDSPRS